MAADTHEPVPAAMRRGGRRRWTILISIILLIYVIAYIDRVNISFVMETIQGQLDMTAGQAGWAAGIFFIGYLVLQVPGGYLAQRWSAKHVVAVLMLLWGATAIAQGLVSSYEHLVITRFFLGVFEGGVQPALMVLINAWFPVVEKTRANSLFILHNPIATAITGPFAGMILAFGSWRELFIIQGLLPFVALIVWWLLAANLPSKAKWLSSGEAAEIERLRAKDETPTTPANWRDAVLSPYVWILALLGFLVWFGFYGLQLWLPTMLRQSFDNEIVIGFVFMIPPAVAAVAIILNGRGADRDGRYTLRVAIPLLLGGLILVLSTLVPTDNRWVLVAVLAVATACQLAFFGSYWTINSRLLKPSAIGAGFGIINGVGNLGGLLGPYAGGWIQDATGSLTIASIVFGVAVALAGFIALALTPAVRRTEVDVSR